jgi:hypothetical protein
MMGAGDRESESAEAEAVDCQSSGWCFPEDTQLESLEAGSGWQRIDDCVDQVLGKQHKEDL